MARPRATRRPPFAAAGALLAAGFAAAAGALAQSQPAMPPTPADADLERRANELIERGARFLLAAQGKDGDWAGERGPGVTALAVKALAQAPGVGPRHPAVARGVDAVLRAQRDDGGVYGAEGLLKNYESSVALSMLAAVDPPRHRARIERLQRFLADLQWDESEDVSIDNPWYGGAGYGHGKRPDLSNTQMMLDALHDSGLPRDDPTYRKALVFIARCQMRGESNDRPFASGSSDGGFIYSPHGAGESKAGEWDVQGRRELRSYGSMTYAGFKSMLYCGLTRDDPRVRAALEWIGRHWTLDFNPNMPEKQSKEGLFYYYHVFARALAALGDDVVRDALGREHHWRRELVEKLARLQQPDGSWINEHDRWMEGIPALTTAYSMLALEAALAPRVNAAPRRPKPHPDRPPRSARPSRGR